MDFTNGENIIRMLENSKTNAYGDGVIEKLILSGEEYFVLEKIIDGTLDKNILKIMLPIKEKSNSLDWEDFRTLLEIGVLDGELELSDINFLRPAGGTLC